MAGETRSGGRVRWHSLGLKRRQAGRGLSIPSVTLGGSGWRLGGHNLHRSTSRVWGRVVDVTRTPPSPSLTGALRLGAEKTWEDLGGSGWAVFT